MLQETLPYAPRKPPENLHLIEPAQNMKTWVWMLTEDANTMNSRRIFVYLYSCFSLWPEYEYKATSMVMNINIIFETNKYCRHGLKSWHRQWYWPYICCIGIGNFDSLSIVSAHLISNIGIIPVILKRIGNTSIKWYFKPGIWISIKKIYEYKFEKNSCISIAFLCYDISAIIYEKGITWGCEVAVIYASLLCNKKI